MTALKKTIGIWGDSILKGVVLDEIKGGYHMLRDSCVQLIKRQAKINIINRSRFGCTIDKGEKLLVQALHKGLDCDYILLEYGGNDCDFDWPAVVLDPDADHQPNTTLQQFRSTLGNMIDELKAHSIAPVLMSLPPIDGPGYFNFLVSKGLDEQRLLRFLGNPWQIYQHHESYSLAITEIAFSNNCHYIPVREEFLKTRNSFELMCQDGIHPNARGHQLMQQVFSRMPAYG